LIKRIEAGASVKLGSVEVGEVKLTPKKKQRRRMRQEEEESEGEDESEQIKEALNRWGRGPFEFDSDSDSDSDSESDGESLIGSVPFDGNLGNTAEDYASEVNGPKYSYRSLALLAEDLALRKVQEEEGLPFVRQVSTRYGDFDAFYAANNRQVAVEVKYFPAGIPLAPLYKFAERTHERDPDENRAPLTLILVVVTNFSRPSIEIDRLRGLLSDIKGHTVIRNYSLESLAGEYGINIDPDTY